MSNGSAGGGAFASSSPDYELSSSLSSESDADDASFDDSSLSDSASEDYARCRTRRYQNRRTTIPWRTTVAVAVEGPRVRRDLFGGDARLPALAETRTARGLRRRIGRFGGQAPRHTVDLVAHH